MISRSTAAPARLDAKMPTASAALISPPHLAGSPSSADRPNPAPAMLPTLNTSPPKMTSSASTWPLPGSAALASADALRRDSAIMRQTLSCTTKSMRTDARMPKANAGPSFVVKVAVCVMNPGPMADVAIRKMAAMIDERRDFTKSAPEEDGAGVAT